MTYEGLCKDVSREELSVLHSPTVDDLSQWSLGSTLSFCVGGAIMSFSSVEVVKGKKYSAKFQPYDC